MIVAVASRLDRGKEASVDWYLDGWKQYAVFSGRARRRAYWMFFLGNVVVGMVLGFIEGFAGGPGLAGGLYSLAVIIPSLAVSVRRLHDTDRSGWWLFLGLLPVIGTIVLLVFMVQDSQPGSNRYGANPKAATA